MNFLKGMDDLIINLVPETCKEALPLKVVNEIKEELNGIAKYGTVLTLILPWLGLAKLSKADLASPDIKDFLQLMAEPIINLDANTTKAFYPAFGVILEFMQDVAKTRLLDAVTSFGNFVVDLDNKDKAASELMQAGAKAGKIGDGSDWADIARLSTAVLRRIVPTLTVEAANVTVNETEVDIKTACCASRFYEMHILVGSSEAFLSHADINGKTMITTFLDHVQTLSPIFAIVKQTVASFEDSDSKARLDQVLSRVEEQTLGQICGFGEKIMSVFKD